jgi:hypothetical protein
VSGAKDENVARSFEWTPPAYFKHRDQRNQMTDLGWTALLAVGSPSASPVRGSQWDAPRAERQGESTATAYSEESRPSTGTNTLGWPFKTCPNYSVALVRERTTATE